MNRNKATHEGTCQWCGRQQKLPEGVLAKHGYTTKWGFFSGVCRGAEEEPFELSCELVKKSIVWAQAQKTDVLALIDKLEKDEGDTAWIHDRVQRKGRCTYEWREVKVEMGDFGGTKMPYFTNWYGQKQWAITYSGGGTVKEMVRKLNDQRIWSLKKDISSINAYIAHQTERVTNWKPGTLKEVEA